MNKINFPILFSTALLGITLLPRSAYAWHVGTGFSTLSDGRAIPAVTGGVGLGKWSLTGMAAGVRTTAYYANAYQTNLLYQDEWGKFWFGELVVGFGGGVYYGSKGVYTETDASGELSGIDRNSDFQIGPAFRVAFKPSKALYIGVEYLLGINTGSLGWGWPNTGLGSIGVEF